MNETAEKVRELLLQARGLEQQAKACREFGCPREVDSGALP
jgi:hypothetical protein